jgi:hypothetical protein
MSYRQARNGYSGVRFVSSKHSSSGNNPRSICVRELFEESNEISFTSCHTAYRRRAVIR